MFKFKYHLFHLFFILTALPPPSPLLSIYPHLLFYSSFGSRPPMSLNTAWHIKVRQDRAPPLTTGCLFCWLYTGRANHLPESCRSAQKCVWNSRARSRGFLSEIQKVIPIPISVVCRSYKLGIKDKLECHVILEQNRSRHFHKSGAHSILFFLLL